MVNNAVMIIVSDGVALETTCGRSGDNRACIVGRRLNL